MTFLPLWHASKYVWCYADKASILCGSTIKVATITSDWLLCDQTKPQKVFKTTGPCRVGLVVSVSASHSVGRGFASRPGHTNDHHNNCLAALHAML